MNQSLKDLIIEDFTKKNLSPFAISVKREVDIVEVINVLRVVKRVAPKALTPN